jgi:hypothetical protein
MQILKQLIMSTLNFDGYWTGIFEGTNQGGLTANLKEEKGVIGGTARFSEPKLGQYEYIVTGVPADPLTLRLIPGRGSDHFNLGKIVIIGAMNGDGALSGRWTSDIGTEGVFSMKRFEQPKVQEQLPSKNSVFLVHGHDEGAKYAVARFLEQLGVKPVILQEQINRGMTVIEKFEDFANRAGFAVVLRNH